MLTDRITLAPTAEPEPEDYFSSALGVIFPDDITNQHGDPSTPVIYTSPTYGKVFLSLADPVGEDSRKLFAQYLWNAGVYMAVALEDAVEGTVFGERPADPEEKNNTAGDGADENESHPSTDPLHDPRINTQPPNNTNQPLSPSPPALHPPSSPPTIPSPTASHKPKSPWDVRNETVLELGSGTGLAGIIAAKCGARRVLLTDYPAPEVLANLVANVERNCSDEEERGRCRVGGHEWGEVPTGGGGGEGREMFTRILVADCLWMPSQHENLRRSIAYYLAPSPPPPTAPLSPDSSSPSFTITTTHADPNPNSSTHSPTSPPPLPHLPKPKPKPKQPPAAPS